MSAGRYFSIVFAFNAAGFALLGWLLESWGGGRVDWAKVAGVALLMGIATADLARRLAGAETGEVRAGFGAYRSGTRWMIFLWASLVGALAVSAALVAAFA